MKKLAAVILLSIHFFNLAGYPFLFRYLTMQSGLQATAKIQQNNYNDAELVELKVPLNLPYVSNWSDYERYDGEITIEGVHHNYVKRKVTADTLYLLCLPNKETGKLMLAKNEYSKKVNDFDGSDNDAANTAKKANLLNYYHHQETSFQFEPTPVVNATEHVALTSPLHKLFLPKDDRPPEINS